MEVILLPYPTYKLGHYYSELRQIKCYVNILLNTFHKMLRTNCSVSYLQCPAYRIILLHFRIRVIHFSNNHIVNFAVSTNSFKHFHLELVKTHDCFLYSIVMSLGTTIS